MTTSNENAWLADAACRGESPSVFFPEKGDIQQGVRAKVICAGCTVRTECCVDRMSSVAPGAEQGIYAGMGPKERSRLAASLGFFGTKGTSLSAAEVYARTATYVGEAHKLTVAA